MKKEDLYELHLVDGLKSRIGSQEVRYKVVRLRETAVEDEMIAVEMAERLMHIGGKPTLVLSDDIYRMALTMRHVEKFTMPGLEDIGLDLLDLKLFGKLSPFDLHRIEERCVLIGLAAQVRYGLLSAADFDKLLSGEPVQEVTPSPRSEGQTAELDGDGAPHQSGPQLLADHSVQRP